MHMSLMTLKTSHHGGHTPVPSRQPLWAQPADICRTGWGWLWFDQSESCGYLCSGSAHSCPGYIWAPIMSGSQPGGVMAHCARSGPGPISHFYLNCNVSPPCSHCMMYPNVSKSIQSVSIRCICDVCTEYLAILEHSSIAALSVIVMEWIKN